MVELRPREWGPRRPLEGVQVQLGGSTLDYLLGAQVVEVEGGWAVQEEWTMNEETREGVWPPPMVKATK